MMKVLFKKSVQLICWASTILLLISGREVSDEIYSVLFAIAILNMAVNPKNICSLENRPLNFLGTISYGIYMFHPLAITLALRIDQAVFTDVNLIAPNIFLYTLAILFSVGLAVISYYGYEKIFLRLKKYF